MKHSIKLLIAGLVLSCLTILIGEFLKYRYRQDVINAYAWCVNTASNHSESSAGNSTCNRLAQSLHRTKSGSLRAP